MLKRVAGPEINELMVTLKNSGGVELDKESVVMNAYNAEISAVAEDNAATAAPGQPKAVLVCRKNSHPFQERTLILDQPVKIGRSVARARPSATNGIFDCKVLSRNHAVIWYENEKFFIQDTKSSNGTFVNNQRLSKGSEDSPAREIVSGDVVQFGVDVLENQRKVTHGCIVATIKLFLPNGKEAKAGQSTSAPVSKSVIAQEEICKLQVIIYEAQQREERLHDKLEELQSIIGKLEVACQEALTNRFEETRLLSKIENLEKQSKVMNKIRPGSADKASEKAEMEIHQLLLDVEKVQSASREIQERQHRQLLENEQKLVEAQRVASNLQLEMIGLRDQASRSDSQVQELAKRCTSYSQLIDLLKETLSVQILSNQELEAKVEELQQKEAELRNNFQKSAKLKKKSKLISDESDEDVSKKDKESDDIVLEWLDRYYTESGVIEQRDRINEDDRLETITKPLESLRDALHNGLQHISSCIGQLDTARFDLEKSKKEVEKQNEKKVELLSQLEPFRYPVDQNEKTEDDVESEKEEIEKSLMMSIDNEKITELINELKEVEDLLNEARQKQKEAEARCNKLKCELDAAIYRCEKLNLESCSLRSTLKNHSDCLEVSADILRQHIAKLELEKEKTDEKTVEKTVFETQGIKNVDNKESQTMSITLVTSETNTESLEEESKIMEELTGSLDKDVSEQQVELARDLVDNPSLGEFVSNDLENGSTGRESEEKEIDSSESQISGDSKTSEEIPKVEDQISPSNLGVWEKIQRIQNYSSRLVSDSSLSVNEIKEMKELVNLIAEDLVRLLMREQQMDRDRQNLQERLDKSMSQADIAALGLANQFLALMIGVFLYYVGGSALEFLGLTR